MSADGVPDTLVDAGPPGAGLERMPPRMVGADAWGRDTEATHPLGLATFSGLSNRPNPSYTPAWVAGADPPENLAHENPVRSRRVLTKGGTTMKRTIILSAIAVGLVGSGAVLAQAQQQQPPGADQMCQQEAQQLGGRAATRTWHAYLSQQQRGNEPRINARTRIGQGPWYNVRGQLIASGVADLHGDQPTDRDRNNIQRATGLDVKGNAIPGAGGPPGTNQHDMLTGSDPDGRAFIDGIDHTCNNWTSDQMTLPQQNANVPADRARAMLGHVDRTGGNNTSWNAAHMSQGCTKQALINTGGAGRFYCFATN
jgi:hypothetical protein